MRRMGVVVAKKALSLCLLTAALFCLTAAGCNNSCVSFNSNPSTGTLVINVNDTKSSCTLSRANGTVQVRVGASSAPSAGSVPSSIQHIFVSLRSVAAHPSAVADEDSSEWQELAPQLAQQPVQVDLMTRSADSCAPVLFGEAAVPAGTYRQVRLRLLPNQPVTGEPVPEENACGSVGFHCIVTRDGSIRPLALDGGAPELRIASERIAGGFFLVLPYACMDLIIEFNAYAAPTLPAGNPVQPVPMFAAAPRATCQSS